MSLPSQHMQSAFNTGTNTYNDTSRSIKPKPSFQRHTSQTYHAARQMNTNHTKTMQTLGKQYKKM